MSQNNFEKFTDLRIQKGFEYIRWLMLIATGAFSILVNLLFIKPENLHHIAILKSALTANAVGIIFGAISAYGEAMIMKGVVRSLCDIEIYKLQGKQNLAKSTPAGYILPWYMKFIERLFYLSLVTDLILLVIFMWRQ